MSEPNAADDWHKIATEAASKAVSHIEAGAIEKANKLMSISRFAGEMEILILREREENSHE
jgi:hypothetical protein